MNTSKRHSNTVIIVIIVLIIIFLGLGGYFFVVKKDQMKQVPSNDSSTIQVTQPVGISSPTIIPTQPASISSPTIIPSQPLTKSDIESVEQNGIKMTITPTHGPAGTKVKIDILGIVPNSNAPYATISFLAINGLGKDDDTSAYTFNTTKIQNGSYETTYLIPNTVLTSQPGDQNYTKEAPIGIGNGNITFSYQHPALHDISLKAPFSVTSN